MEIKTFLLRAFVSTSIHRYKAEAICDWLVFLRRWGLSGEMNGEGAIDGV